MFGMGQGINHRFKMFSLLIYFFSLLHSSESCIDIDGSNTYLGAVFEPFTKPGGRTSSLYPKEEIISMIQILSSRFHRISTYGNEEINSPGSKVLTAAAEVNKNATNTSSIIRVNAAIWERDTITITAPLDVILKSIKSANQIYPGTVTGLIITSHFTQHSNLPKLMEFFREAKITLNGSVQIGTRSSNCEQLAHDISKNDERVVQTLKVLNFIICHQLPKHFSTPEESAAVLIEEFSNMNRTFKQAIPSLEMIGETGWPSDGGIAKNNIVPSVSNMKRFWCKINEWSLTNFIKIDFIEAFDQPWKAALGVPEPHYGWWIRLNNETSYPSDFEEKVVHNFEKPPPSRVTTIALSIAGSLAFIALLSTTAFLYYKLKIAEKQLLSKKDIEEFEKGCIGLGKDYANVVDDALKLPYDRQYEIPKSKFQIDSAQLLGKGAFGSVYKGHLEGFEKDVAFKMTQPNSTATNLKSLLSEIKIMIHVGQHPNVVCIIGAFTGEMRRGRILIATELCDKGSLEEYLHKISQSLGNQAYANFETQEMYCNPVGSFSSTGESSVKLAFKKLLQWSYEIANGMEYIASRNVIHADLAARNVLLTADETAKITDFGLSKRLYEYTNYVKQNQEPMPWRWMAVESLTQLTFSTKSDVWAFGVTLYEIFGLGDIPYPGLSWSQDFTQNLRNGMRLNKPSFASEPIYQIMSSCWALNPNERPDFTNLKESLHNLK